MPDDIPKEDEPIPSVDPEDLRRRWTSKTPQAGQGVDFLAASRDGMIRMLAEFNGGQLLVPWRHGEELDDAVFRVAATFPMRWGHHRTYKIAGDDIFEFDPNAFVQRLIEETGVSHTWDPIPTKLSEGDFLFIFMGALGPKSRARQVLWDAWTKYFKFRPSQRDARDADALAMLFADFVIDNLDLTQQLISACGSRGEGVDPFATMTELERRARAWRPWAS